MTDAAQRECPGRKTAPARSRMDGGNASTEIVVVQTNADLGDSAPASTPPTRYSSIGFDLDGLCTTSSNAASSCTPPNGQETIVDGAGGIDNSFGYIMQRVRNILPDNFSSDIYSQQLREGVANFALRVTGYNGQSDDDDVQVALFSTASFGTSAPGAEPRWDGTDVFPIDVASVTNDDLNQPRTVDPHGFVSGGKLVATFGSLTHQLNFAITNTANVPLTLHLEGAFLVCAISPADVDPSKYNLSCTLAGRWRADDFLHQLLAFPDPTDLQHPHPLCTDTPSYQTFKGSICRSADVASTGVLDPTAPCDALSFGMNFDMSPALLGDLYAVQVLPPGCPVATDPANDSCNM